MYGSTSNYTWHNLILSFGAGPLGIVLCPQPGSVQSSRSLGKSAVGGAKKHHPGHNRTRNRITKGVLIEAISKPSLKEKGLTVNSMLVNLLPPFHPPVQMEFCNSHAKNQVVSSRKCVVKISVGGVDVAGSTLDDVTHMIKSGTRPFEISFLVPDASDIEDTPKGGRIKVRVRLGLGLGLGLGYSHVLCTYFFFWLLLHSTRFPKDTEVAADVKANANAVDSLVTYPSKEQEDKEVGEAKVNFITMPCPENAARLQEDTVISCANMSPPPPRQPEFPPRLPPRQISAALPANQTTTQRSGSMNDTQSVATDEKWENHGEKKWEECYYILGIGG
jgi:hypothetical protein